MSGVEGGLLRHRLEAQGFATRNFAYASMHRDLDRVLARLADQLRREPGEVHLVGHSLGGLVILRLLESADDLPPGRAVLLGSPVRGSAAARSVAGLPLGASILGPLGLQQIVESPPQSVRGGREVGVIAGSVSAGLGRLVTRLPEPNDGTVAVEETRLAGAADHVVLPVSHSSMLFSSSVAEHAARFLRIGRFAEAA